MCGLDWGFKLNDGAARAISARDWRFAGGESTFANGPNANLYTYSCIVIMAAASAHCLWPH